MGIFNNIFKKEKRGKQDKIVKFKKPQEKVVKKPEVKETPLVSSGQSKKDDNKKTPAVAVKKVLPAQTGKREKKEIKKVTPNAYKILIRPLVTEKATYLGMYNKYIFEVSSKFSKIEIKKAVQSVYGVIPVSVNVISVSGKERRYGKVLGRTKNWKKAIITLKQGEKIEIYEGV